MKSFIALVCAIEFIESNLSGRLTVGDVAQASYTSLSHLQSMFSRTFHLSVGDYIVKRKLCQAAYILTNTNDSITDIAFECGYANVESFSRTFKKQFLYAPSAYRREYRFSNLCPRLIIDEKEGFNMVQRYDLTEISEKILGSKGTYIISADIDHLMEINESLGHSAGDAAIAETAARIGRSVEPSMDYFRIGGDAFVVLTGSGDLGAAEKVAQGVLSYAQDEVEWSSGTLHFSISMGIVKIPQSISDAKEVIERADAAMYAAKLDGRNCYKVM